MIKDNFRCILIRATLCGIASIWASWFDLASASASAQELNWPNRPIKMIVNYGPGGSTDNSIRPLGPGLSTALGQQIVIENRGGAAGAIGTEAAQKSPPDGYTFLVTPVAVMMILPQVRKTPYDPFKDFVPVIKHADAISPLTVHPSTGIKSLKELEAYGKKNPGKLTFGGVGLGTSTQLVALMVNQALGIDILYVPYRGAGEALPDILGGVVQVFVDPSGLPHVAAGKLNILGVFNASRHPDYPDIPSMHEVYPALDVTAWFGIFAPAGTPRPIVDKLNAAVTALVAKPETQAQMLKFALRGTTITPEAFTALMKSDHARYGALIKQYKITME